MPKLRNLRVVGRAIERLYPPQLAAEGTGAEVLVKYRIIESGRVDAASIQIVSTTEARFDQTARQVVARMVFAPGMINGRPAKVRVEQPLNSPASRRAGPVARGMQGPPNG